jgi:hypothetical protein
MATVAFEALNTISIHRILTWALAPGGSMPEKGPPLLHMFRTTVEGTLGTLPVVRAISTPFTYQTVKSGSQSMRYMAQSIQEKPDPSVLAAPDPEEEDTDTLKPTPGMALPLVLVVG